MSTDVYRREYRRDDRQRFADELRAFVPPGAFDAHAHVYNLRHIVRDADASDFARQPEIGLLALRERMQQWMGDRTPQAGLYFPFPVENLDTTAANRFLADEIRGQQECRGLMMIRPDDHPDAIETELLRYGFAGFKVYHVFAKRADSFNAEQGEFLPEWAWELAHQYGLAIMMHLVRPRALSDVRNQRYINEHCCRYPNARLILAHAARAFNANHTIEAVNSLRGIENVWFDSSAICESGALESIIETFGVTRLLYGSDFPVSELRGRCVSVGDGFYWLHDNNAEWSNWKHGTPQLIGLESLLALHQASRRMKLIDRDIESIFSNNARQLLDITTTTDRKTDLGQQRYRRAKELIPGGTQLLSKRPEMFAPNQWPAYYEQAIGCEVIDADGRRLIDMSHCGILSCILGYADPDVNAAVIRRVQMGQMATQQTADEVELAELLTQIHPWAQQARFTRSGGEAMAVAIRIARASTGKSKLAVCGYHGWHDWYLAANLAESPDGFPLDAHLLPGLDPSGVPRELSGTIATFNYNRLDELESATERCGDDLAAIVMEPTRSVEPDKGFLEHVRLHADRLGVPLVFDEISSAWRYQLGGAHLRYGVDPDLAVFAKAMSNGYAMAAVLGRKGTMQACEGSFISSTYWTEGIGPAAAVATIRKLMKFDVPKHLEQLGTQVIKGWKSAAKRHQLPIRVGGRPASATLAIEHSQKAELMTLFTTRMLDFGFLAGGVCSLTWAHQPHHVDRYLDAIDRVFGELALAIKQGTIKSQLRGPVKHDSFKRLT